MNFGQLALATLHQHPGPAADIRPTILGRPNPRGLDSAYPQQNAVKNVTALCWVNHGQKNIGKC